MRFKFVNIGKAKGSPASKKDVKVKGAARIKSVRRRPAFDPEGRVKRSHLDVETMTLTVDGEEHVINIDADTKFTVDGHKMLAMGFEDVISTGSIHTVRRVKDVRIDGDVDRVGLGTSNVTIGTMTIGHVGNSSSTIVNGKLVSSTFDKSYDPSTVYTGIVSVTSENKFSVKVGDLDVKCNTFIVKADNIPDLYISGLITVDSCDSLEHTGTVDTIEKCCKVVCLGNVKNVNGMSFSA